ncbi:hypothetical protein [Micromonospora cathayae]|uniref:Uncharacterized protein n=1 Tax=Micromonospora cathayae TaxID=3028804 RepID=A0ABY7ZM73_9ACTN|nr:hypothetical protein [Micromonospora sp. HUAS 3]WDZ83598.1 hypothetical protein PVK37_24505 [Micromonospora sp. HUAS 3]
MTGNDSLQPFRPDGLVPRSTGVPARPGPAAPVHRPGEVRWSDSPASREECWQRLSPAVRGRVDQRIGRMLDWWATDIAGRVSAAVLGTRALVVVNPTVNSAGQPAYELVTVHLAEASFRSAPVRGASPEPTADATAGTTPFGAAPGPAPVGSAPGGSAPGAPGGPAGTLPLGRDFTAVLGLLPPRAQQLVQDPFLASPKPVRGDWYVSYTGNPASLGGAVIRLWCYLTDERTLTFCSGLGHGYREGTGARSWEVTCWRATTLPRSEAANR